MAWTKQTNAGVFFAFEEDITLPSSAVTEFSSVIDFLRFTLEGGHAGFMLIGAHPSAITGDNLDISLYGSYTETGTKYQILDAIIADLTADDTRVFGSVDLKAYPFPFYWIGHLAPGDEDANTISYFITVGATLHTP